MGLASDYIHVTDFIGRIYPERFSEGNTRRREYGSTMQDIGTPVDVASWKKLSFMETKFFWIVAKYFSYSEKLANFHASMGIERCSESI